MPYTPIVSAASLKTHQYLEIIDEITRADDTIIDTAIANGIAEAQIYLFRYDRVQLFGSITDDTAATFTDPYLTGLVKDITMWHIIKLGNPNINYDHARQCYEDAIDALKMIQAGKSNPAWPYFDPTDLEAPDSISVKVYSNTKRTNQY